jgi:chromosome segregation ATPase
MSDEDRERSTGAVTLEDVRAAVGDTDPHNTNAGAVRRVIGRGSLSTIQKHLDALRRERMAAVEASEGDTAALEAPEAPREIMRGLWGSAYGLALASVQSKLIAAQERVAALEQIRQAQGQEIEALTELVDQAELARDQAASEAQAARQAQARAEAERDEALRLHTQIAELMAKLDALQPPQPPAA